MPDRTNAARRARLQSNMHQSYQTESPTPKRPSRNATTPQSYHGCTRILRMAAKQGLPLQFCMPNRTNSILLVTHSVLGGCLFPGAYIDPIQLSQLLRRPDSSRQPQTKCLLLYSYLIALKNNDSCYTRGQSRLRGHNMTCKRNAADVEC
jgi:hypothetical protein